MSLTILDGKSILITGGTGSLGKTLVRRMLSGAHGAPRKIIVFSRDEAKQHDMRLSYLHQAATTDEVTYHNFLRLLEFRIGDIRSYADVSAALRGVDIVINAAALKQVPVCEYFPTQAILTNTLGAENLARAIQDHAFPVDVVAGVSTDKACKPINVMGMTKSLQERIFIAANVLSEHTRFVCVRYGNVLASRGSVIPVFHEQIAAGGPVTVTAPEMTRFLLSLDQAVDTVLAAIASALPGEIYVPVAPSATIMNVAKALIGSRQVELTITGIRPGEKLHEILISEEESPRVVRRGEYYVIRPMLPELASEGVASSPLPFKEYSSSVDTLDPAGTAALLQRNGLLDPASTRAAVELLR